MGGLQSPECNLWLLDSRLGKDNRHFMSTQISSEKIRLLVIETLPKPVSAAGGEAIFGPGGVLDSLDLVNYLADLEYRLEQEFGRELVLASERAMSRGHSPFRDVNALTGYVGELLAE
jgi:acyl carrier protein